MAGEGAHAPAEELGVLPSGWRWARLNELIDQDRGICYGIVQPGKHDPRGVPMVNSQDVVGGRVSPHIEFRVSPELHKRYRRSTILGGEILLTLVGANFGQVAIAPQYLAGFNCSRAVGILPVTESPEFVALCLRSPLVRRYMDNWANTTAQPTFNLKDVANLPIPLPPISERSAIAHILGTLDDKIELNRRMNETLEAMARALFKSWFVDFDPVRAKAERRDIGLPKPLADLFPDSFEDSELGEIPKGWKIKSVADLAEVTSGKRPNERYEERTDQASVPLWGGNGPMAYVTKALYNQPILLTGRVGTLGSVFRINTPCWPSDNTLVLLPKTQHTLEFLFLQLRCIDFSAFNRGSTQPLLTQTDLKNRRFAAPQEDILHKFHEVVGKLFERIDAEENESRILSGLRDTLLPKLISGELQVRAA